MTVLELKFFHLGVIALFVASLFDKPIRDISGRKILLGLFLVMLCSIVLHGLNSFVMNHCLNVFIAIIGLYLIVRFCRNPESCYKYIILATTINIIIFISQKLGWNPMLSFTPKEEVGGLFGNSPRLATYLAMVSPFLLNFSWLLLVASIIVCLVAGEYSIIGIITIMLIIRSRKLWHRLAYLTFGLCGAICFYKNILSSLLFRLSVWKEVLEGFFMFPIKGYGMGIFPYGNDKITANFDPMIYSSLIQFIVCSGILGLIWLIYATDRIKNRFSPDIESLAVLGIFLLSIFEYPLEIYRLWPTMIAIVGFWIIKKEVCNAGKIRG